MKKIFYIVCCALMSCSNNDSSSENSPKEISGKDVYNKWCVICHGENGNANIGGAKDLSISPLSDDEKTHIILNGSENKLMRGFKNDLSEQELRSLLNHLETLKK